MKVHGEVNQAKIDRMSPRERCELEKVIFEEWTVQGRQETLEPASSVQSPTQKIAKMRLKKLLNSQSNESTL